MKKLLFFLLFSNLFFAQEDYQVFNDFYDNVGLSDSQIKVLDIYKKKKFVSETVFLNDLEKLVKNDIYTPSEFQAECLGYYFGLEKASGKINELKKYTYFSIYAAAEGQCLVRDLYSSEPIAKIDVTTIEKPPVLTPIYSEASQYIQVQFSKNKKGINFNDFKIIDGDNVDFDVKNTLLGQMNKDFANDKFGNYTAFYDVFYENDQPKIIKLKSRLNR